VKIFFQLQNVGHRSKPPDLLIRLESKSMSSFGVSPPNLERIFSAFSRYGAPKSDGKELSLKSCEKWMEQANLLDESISSEDLRLLYKKFR
jgi:p25-alpha